MAQISEIKQLFLKFESSLGTNQVQNPPQGGFFVFISLTPKRPRMLKKHNLAGGRFAA
ncbi:hypothetical protein [Asticcacaulis sp. AND118]|uniref:hypothetical protein n=1 Tax=Asticcacaulis sp. AND118 TaxID=2840468 RepID=UPI001CFFF4B9|nr:hypothetical protein [Asticcacaulis sp. AND118]UDF03275.1 hypothetical protein LH365_12645 [Asticcacaulis sp. AND118]